MQIKKFQLCFVAYENIHTIDIYHWIILFYYKIKLYYLIRIYGRYVSGSFREFLRILLGKNKRQWDVLIISDKRLFFD